MSYSNELVNTKIYRLIMDFEAEDTAYLMQRIERNEAFRRRSSRILGGVAIGAVVLRKCQRRQPLGQRSIGRSEIQGSRTVPSLFIRPHFPSMYIV